MKVRLYIYFSSRHVQKKVKMFTLLKRAGPGIFSKIHRSARRARMVPLHLSLLIQFSVYIGGAANSSLGLNFRYIQIISKIFYGIKVPPRPTNSFFCICTILRNNMNAERDETRKFKMKL